MHALHTELLFYFHVSFIAQCRVQGKRLSLGSGGVFCFLSAPRTLTGAHACSLPAAHKSSALLRRHGLGRQVTNHKRRRGTSNDLGAQPHLATRNEVGLVAGAPPLTCHCAGSDPLHFASQSAAQLVHGRYSIEKAPHCWQALIALIAAAFGVLGADEPQKRLDYMRIAKSGSTSLKLLLNAAIKKNATCKPLRLHFHDHTAAQQPEGVPSFAVLRDPCERFISTYDHLVLHRTLNSSEKGCGPRGPGRDC